MIIGPFILGLIFLFFSIVLPFFFKILFGIEKYSAYLLGLISSFITSVFLIILIIISIFSLSAAISKDSDGDFEILINSLNDITVLEDLSFLTLLLAWGLIAIIFLTIFLILFFSIKRISKEEEDSNVIFMYISGYIIIPSLFWYIFCILLSLEKNIFSKLTDNIFDIFTSHFILLIELGGLFFIFLIIGSTIMIMLHYKEFNSFIIWFCVGTYFGPVIFYFLGFLTLKPFFFSFLNGACPLLSLVFSCFLYRKYAGDQRDSTHLYDNNVEMAS